MNLYEPNLNFWAQSCVKHNCSYFYLFFKNYFNKILIIFYFINIFVINIYNIFIKFKFYYIRIYRYFYLIILIKT